MSRRKRTLPIGADPDRVVGLLTSDQQDRHAAAYQEGHAAGYRAGWTAALTEIGRLVASKRIGYEGAWRLCRLVPTPPEVSCLPPIREKELP